MGWKDKNDPWEIDNSSWTGNNGSWDFSKTDADHFYNEGNLISSSYNPVFPILNPTGNPVTPNHDPCGYWFNISTSVLIEHELENGDDNPQYGPNPPGGGSGDDPCTDAEDIEISLISSIEYIPESSYGNVFISGGMSNLYVEITGTGFFLDEGRTLKAIDVVNTRSVTVYTNAVACGIGELVIADDCSVDTYEIRSDGEWVGTAYAYYIGPSLTEYLRDYKYQIAGFSDCWIDTIMGDLWGIPSLSSLRVISRYRWVESNNVWAGDGSLGGSWVSAEDVNAIADMLLLRGFPLNVYPNTYASNGPEDILDILCTIDSDPIMWKCSE